MGGKDDLLVMSYVARLLAETTVQWDPDVIADLKAWGGKFPPTPKPPPGEIFDKLAKAAKEPERRSKKE